VVRRARCRAFVGVPVGSMENETRSERAQRMRHKLLESRWSPP
jgi:hypothetical protein